MDARDRRAGARAGADVVFHRDAAAGDHALAVLILVVPPGAPVVAPEVTATRDGADLVLAWSGRVLRLPAAPR